MQNIVQLSKLREYLLPLDESLISEREGPLTFRLREFMANMWNGEGTYNPSSLHSTIVKAAPQFRGFRQQDSHELLRCLLDGVRMEEIDRIRAIGEIEKSKTPNTFIDELFGGKLISCITCHTCKNISTVNEAFHDILLPIVSASQTQAGEKARKKKRAKQTVSVNEQMKQIQLERQQKFLQRKKEMEEKKEKEEQEKNQSETKVGEENNSENALLDENKELSNAEEKPEESNTEIQNESKVSNNKENNESDEIKNEEEKKEEKEEEEEDNENELFDYRKNGVLLNDGGLSLFSCIQKFTDPELLEGENAYKCLKCTRKKYRQVLEKICEAKGDFSELMEEDDIPEEKLKKYVSCTATKQFMIKEAPEILTLGLKRFAKSGFRMRKIDDFVEFPYTLDLEPFIYEREDGCSYKYCLSGISVHGGGLGGGHYVAYIKHSPKSNSSKDTNWYYFSDSVKRESSIDDVLKREAYVLLYTKINEN